MQNLRRIKSFAKRFKENQSSGADDDFTIDPDTSNVYFISEYQLLEMKINDSMKVNTLLDISKVQPRIRSDKARLKYLGFNEESLCVYIGYSNGCFLTYDVVKKSCTKYDHTLKEEVVSMIGHFGSCNRFAVVTGKGNLHVLRLDFSTVKIEPLFSNDGKDVLMSWNDDGSLLLVNAPDPSSVRENFFFLKNGKHRRKNSSEEISRLRDCIDWHGPKNLISAVQRLEGQCQIVFLEWNGISRPEFNLCVLGKSVEIRGIRWSRDKSVLAVVVYDEEVNLGPRWRIKFLSLCKHTWYLKQSLVLKSCSIKNCFWHPSEDLTFVILTSNSTYQQYSFAWVTDKSDHPSPHDEAIIAVIKDTDIILNPLARGLDLSGQSLLKSTHSFKSVLPLQILFPKHHSENKFAVLLQHCLKIFSKLTSKHSGSTAQSGFSYEYSHDLVLPSSFKDLWLSTWLWISPNIFIVVELPTDIRSILTLYMVDKSNKLQFVKNLVLDEVAPCIIASCEPSIALVQLESGKVMRYYWAVNKIEELFTFETFCPVMLTCYADNEELVFGFNEKESTLYCDEDTISYKCMSFTLNDEWLIFNELNGTLHVRPLARCRQTSDDYTMTVDRDCRIVSCVKNGTRVFLLNSDGCLVGVDPPSLVLRDFSKYLAYLKFREALKFLQKHQIDTNVLFDLDPDQLFDNIDEFVSQMDSEDIQKLLCNLKKENVALELLNSKYLKNTGDKLNTVFSKMGTALTNADPKKFLKPIFLTFVKMDPPELEQVLQKLKELGEEERNEVLDYLEDFVDMTDLRDAAVEIGDRDLIPVLSQRARKDSQEIQQNLNGNCSSETPQSLEDSLDLSVQDFNRSPQRVKYHDLFEKELLTPDLENFSQRCISRAEHFKTLNKFDEAGIWFRKGGDLKMALEAFEKGLKWKEAFCVARELKCEESELEELRGRLSDRLVDEGRFAEGAIIQERYLKNVERSIQILIDGCLWKSALEMIYRCNKRELLQSQHLQNSVERNCKLLTDEISQLRTKFDKCDARSYDKAKNDAIMLEVDKIKENFQNVLQIINWLNLIEEANLLQSKMDLLTQHPMNQPPTEHLFNPGSSSTSSADGIHFCETDLRNLRLLVAFPILVDYDLECPGACCVDPKRQCVYFVSGARLFLLVPKRSKLYELVNISKEKTEMMVDELIIQNITFNPEFDVVCMVFKNGYMAFFNIDTEETEYENQIKDEILSAVWDYDVESLALVTVAGDVHVFSTEFEPEGVTPIFFDDQRKKKLSGKESETHLSWKKDGSSFAVSAKDKSIDECRIFIFSRKGELQFTTEVISGLQSWVDWSGPCDLLTTLQQLPNKLQIVFLEENGVMREEMVLPISDDNNTWVRGCFWNRDSSVLAVLVDDFIETSESLSQVQLFSWNNHHWYLKQVLTVPSIGRFFTRDVLWHPTEVLTLLLRTADDRFLWYSWKWITDKIDDPVSDDHSVVAVIDGNDVVMIPFARGISQDPDLTYKLTFPCQVQQILFPKHHSENEMAVVTTDYKIAFYRKATTFVDKSGTKFRINRYVRDRIFTKISLEYESINEDRSPSYCYNWFWMSRNVVITAASHMIYSLVTQLSMDESSDKIFICQELFEGVVQSITPSCNSNIAIIQMRGGAVIRYLEDKNTSENWFKFETFCPTVSSCVIGDKEAVFGFNGKDCLYCMDNTLSRNCTSFILRDKFLLFTEENGTLHSVPLNPDLFRKLNQLRKGTSRLIDPGSRIVTCDKNGSSVVVQTVQGNIKTIHL